MWNLRNKTDEHTGGGEGNKPEETFKVREKNEGWWREVGGGWAKWVMGIKEGTCDEHWVLYTTDKSLNSTPETNNTLYVN